MNPGICLDNEKQAQLDLFAQGINHMDQPASLTRSFLDETNYDRSKFRRNEPRSLLLDFQDNHRSCKFCNMDCLRFLLGLELELERGLVRHYSMSLDTVAAWGHMLDG